MSTPIAIPGSDKPENGNTADGGGAGAGLRRRQGSVSGSTDWSAYARSPFASSLGAASAGHGSGSILTMLGLRNQQTSPVTPAQQDLSSSAGSDATATFTDRRVASSSSGTSATTPFMHFSPSTSSSSSGSTGGADSVPVTPPSYGHADLAQDGNPKLDQRSYARGRDLDHSQQQHDHHDEMHDIFDDFSSPASSNLYSQMSPLSKSLSAYASSNPSAYAARRASFSDSDPGTGKQRQGMFGWLNNPQQPGKLATPGGNVATSPSDNNPMGLFRRLSRSSQRKVWECRL